MNWLQELDKTWFLRINGYHGETADQFMRILSWKHSWIIYLPFLVVYFRKEGWKKSLTALAGTIAAFAITDLTAARLIKPFFSRLRPCHDPGISELVHLVDGCGGQFGFVSNHAANHFGLALLFGWIIRKQFPGTLKWFLLFAFIVSYSRVYMGVHYPGDVLAGGVLGAAAALLVIAILRKLDL